MSDLAEAYCWLIGVFVVVFAITAFVRGQLRRADEEHVASLPPEEAERLREERRLEAKRVADRRHETRMNLQQGSINPALICPHCQKKGAVRTKPIKKKVGISGGKATAAVLTGGVSMLATGLSRKEAMTQASCGKCGSKWAF